MELSDKDRQAVVLRFFSGLSFAELGRRLKLTEDGARFRVNRTLEKLQRLLLKRGVTSTSAALGAALNNHAVGSVPPGLAILVSKSAIAAAAGGTGPTLLTLLAMSKTKLAVASCAVVMGGAVWMLPLRNSDRGNSSGPGGFLFGHGAATETGASAGSLSEVPAGANQAFRPASDAFETIVPVSTQHVATAENPRSREQLAKYDRYGDFFLQRELSDEQSARMVELLIQQDEARADLQAAVRLHQLDGDTVGIDDLRRRLYRPITDEIEGILGAEGYREFRDYEGTSAYRMAIVRPVSTVLQDAGVPITETQSSRLIAVLASNNQPVRRNSTDVTKEANIAWDAVLAEAAEFISPPQMVILESEFARRKANQAAKLGSVEPSASSRAGSR